MADRTLNTKNSPENVAPASELGGAHAPARTRSAGLLGLCAEFQAASAELARLESLDGGDREKVAVAADRQWLATVKRITGMQPIAPAERQAKAKAAFAAMVRKVSVETGVPWEDQAVPEDALAITTLRELAAGEMSLPDIEDAGFKINGVGQALLAICQSSQAQDGELADGLNLLGYQAVEAARVISTYVDKQCSPA